MSIHRFKSPPFLLATAVFLFTILASSVATAQTSYTWDQVRAKFDAVNPALKADAFGVDELRAEEITAYLRPNPQFNFAVDGTQFPHKAPYQPLISDQEQSSFSYLHERQHKRELRRESAVEGTRIGQSLHEDLTRSMVFVLRSAFVQTLQAKQVLDLANADLDYYDKIIDISRNRLRAGDLAQIDFDRIELLRVQYESELQTAIVNLRTAKIQLLQLLNGRTPVDQFDVSGPFDFSATLKPVEDFRQIALDTLAVSNGSTDPTYSLWWTHNPSFNNINPGEDTLGGSFNIPLRIFDRNQGEKKRTLIDIDRSNQLTDAARAQVFSDVDTSYEEVRSNIALLQPYKDKYRDQATRVRDTVTYAYLHGGASLMDFLSAQSDYRVVQLAYAQLIGAYLTAVGQLNLAVGREVIQ
jgi:cobalt-zinc-cadmium efflux system outer membrane protein